LVKKTPLSEYGNIRSSGIIAIKLKGGDSLAWAELTKGDDRVLMVSHEGKAIKFSEKDIRPMGRATSGVTGMKIKAGDYVVTMEVIPGELDKPEDKRRKWFRQLLTIMEKGLGKRTAVAEFPLQKRAGQGVKVANVTEKTGKVAAAALVNQDVEQIIISTKNAQTIKLPLKNIPKLGRLTQGVILMRPRSGDKVTAMAVLEKKGEEDEKKKS
jgi:DNA gyrase subunit A